ncbi:MAG: TIGR01244 family sulfur transferase [Pseudomonadota bacterium]
MDIRALTPDYAVSPQIAPEDMPAIAAAGYTTVLCNRPDEEIPMELSAEVMAIAAEAAGLAFEVLPVTHAGLTLDLVSEQGRIVSEATGPVLAYCASGTRSSIVWCLSQAGKVPTEDLVTAARGAGYELGHLAPQIDALAGR